MTPGEEKRLSKFLSLVLRHEPAAAAVTLNSEGWVAISDLISGAASMGMNFTRDDIAQVVANSDKKRFTISLNGNAIRAAQGHSLIVDLSLEPTSPPTVLFHGTAEHRVAAIQAEGLNAGSRQHVHLSPDIATAMTVGKRHGRPAVFRVDARRAAFDGHRFYRAENGVWLTDPLSASYLVLVDTE